VISPTWAIMPVLDNLSQTLDAAQGVLLQTVPTRLLIIDQGSSDETRDTLRLLAEAEPLRVRLWLHDPPLPSLAATWNTALNFVWGLGGTAAWVVNNDIRVHPETLHTLLGMLDDAEALLVSATGVDQAGWDLAHDGWPQRVMTPENLAQRGGPDFSCYVIRHACHTQFPFDEGFVPAYCVVPETPVLTKDLQWVPIGSVRAGDWLLGVDEHSGPRAKGEYYRRRYLPAQVFSVHRRLAPCLRIRMVDGREVVCTTDHKWLVRTRHAGPSYEWRCCRTLRPGWFIAAPLDPWQAPSTYAEGWLAGIIDGEGCLRQTGRNKFEINISQRPGTVLDQIHAYLSRLGIPFTGRVRPDNDVAVVEVGIRRHVFRLLGQIRPQRLLTNVRWDDVCTFSRGAPMALAIDTITDAGVQEVVTVETSTKTYLANGMIAHNCEDLDLHRRLLLAGRGPQVFSLNYPFLHYASGTLKAMTPEKRANLERRIGHSRAYYQKKWGGNCNEERFLRPFDEASAVEDGSATTPWLQFHA
jgi:hypothetical protein